MLYYNEASDEELLVLINLDDEKAFTEIYNRYWESLYHSSFAVLKDRCACLDILQEIFIWIWSNRNRLNVNSLKSYLYGAVKFKIANYIRDGKLRVDHYSKVREIVERDHYSTIESTLEVKELKEIIDLFTQELPNKRKEIFDLSRNKLLKNKEIAHKLNISEKTVENQLTNALKKLRIRLSRYY